MKSSPRAIIIAHYRSYIDVRTGLRRWQDYIEPVIIPMLLFGVCLVIKVRVSTTLAVGLLTISGIFSALLFGVMLQISERAMDWADSHPIPSRTTSEHAIYLSELAANAGYASIVCILGSIVFVGVSVSTGWLLVVTSAIGISLGVHLIVVFFMIIKRIFALTQERLNKARTCDDESLYQDHRQQNK